MALLLTLGLVASNPALTGAELIQHCRQQRVKTLAATNDKEYTERQYLACLERG